MKKISIYNIYNGYTDNINNIKYSIIDNTINRSFNISTFKKE